MKINAKDLIQKMWVLEVFILIIFGLFAILFMKNMDRVNIFVSMLPLYSALIGGQGIIAGVGPEIKRLINAKYNQTEVPVSPPDTEEIGG